jgi:branched-chain amino acid transport system ATP-binding protein
MTDAVTDATIDFVPDASADALGEARTTPVLEVEDVSLSFGAVAALSEVSFTVSAGELFALIGPNGAGKTTMFNLLSGIYVPTAGHIRYLGTDLATYRPHDLAGLGIARTFQNLALLPELSVLENVLVGRTHLMKSGAVRLGLGLRAARREERANRAAAMEAVEFVGLAEVANRPVAKLAYGLRKRVELARVVAMEPKLLLLDEPVAGMSPTEKSEITSLLRAVHERLAPTVVLVEHDMTVVMSLAERVLVLDFGRTIAVGTPAEIQASPEVIRAYLGEPDPDEAEVQREEAQA